jgi:hypothetical protein
MRNLPLLVSVHLLALAVPALAQTPIDVRPRQPGPEDAIEVHLAGFEEGCPPFFSLESVKDGVVVLRGQIVPTLAPCPPAAWTGTVALPPLPPGSYRIEARITGPALQDFLHAATSIEVAPWSETLSLHGESFVASIVWHLPGDGGSGRGFARALTSESGWFWFFSPDNLEVTLKVLDGRPVNGHWWVFLASMTNVGFTVTVYDNRSGCLGLPVTPPVCPSWTFTNPPSVNANRLDTQAFPAEP